MITYEDIKKANDAIKATPIKGKDYAEVPQRIKAFRMVYPTGTILTEMLSNENGVCVFKATVSFKDETGEQVILGIGTAYEKEGSTFINKTSYIENCETSAVGRALGMAGFGIDTSVASAEEVQNAQLNQKEGDKVEKINKKQFEDLKTMYTGDEIKAMCKELGISKTSDIPLEYYIKKISEYLGKTNNFPESKDGYY